MHWRPSADLPALQRRAALLADIRRFFDERGVLEVETPLLAQHTVTDPALEPLCVESGASIDSVRYLQTSPEYHMKRLLAAHGEPIYQVARVFRDGEVGPRHNPEFTLLEWYRPGFDLHALMREVQSLVHHCLGDCPVHFHSYRELFEQVLQVDPHTAGAAELERIARAQIDAGDIEGDRDLWLDLLMSHVVEPHLATLPLCFVYDYPASQAALAQVAEVDGVVVAQRFETYLHGVELANGYCELRCEKEQRQRFERDNATRVGRGLPPVPLDECLLQALEHGLPACSGVALGVDRLLLAATEAADVSAVLAFDWSRA